MELLIMGSYIFTRWFMVRNKSGKSFEGVLFLRLIRFAFLLFLVVLLISAYYLQTEGKLISVIQNILFVKGIPFVKTYWYEIVVSVTLFSLGFWCGRASTDIYERR
jgi:hypothetical protein